MPSTWEDPDLGRFEYDRLLHSWTRSIHMPGFSAFRCYAEKDYDPCPLGFFVADERAHPSPTAVSLAKKVLANQDDLVARVTSALWDDFNGNGPSTGMWWHDHLDRVIEAMEVNLPSLSSPGDLLGALRLLGVYVFEAFERHDGPLAYLHFAAAFEEEHGLGILTDGSAVLGIGYSSDVSVFE